MYILPQNRFSNGAKQLSKALNIARIFPGKKYSFKSGGPIINWGVGEAEANFPRGMKIINPPDKVARSVNKLTFFQLMKGIQYNDRDILPPFATSKAEAAKLFTGDGSLVVCRRVLNGSGGDGIVIADSAGELVDCRLYVKYIPKETEWRVHIFRGQVIDIQKKAKRNDADTVDWRVRNHANGFIYMRNNIAPPDSVPAVALLAMNKTELDFGAVDVITTKSGRSYVLEINSAPGLEGTTVQSYAKVFAKLKE